MATISAAIKIIDGFSAPLSKLSNSLGRAKSSFAGLKTVMNDGKVGSGSSFFKSALGANVIGNGISRAAGAVGNGVRGMVGELDQASTSWQTFDGNMKMLGKSPQQIASTRKDLQKFAVQTIYSASDMASTYSQLAAVGTKNTKKLVKGFGGLASAADNPQQAMKTLSQQATQAAAKPNIQWADFRLMLEQTPAGMAAVAKQMGKSTSELVTDVQDGTVKTQDFFDAIAKVGTNKDFTKMATQYKTVGQAMDGLKESIITGLLTPYSKVGSVGIKAISQLSDKIATVNFDSVGKKLEQGLNYGQKAVSAFWKSFKNTGAIRSIQTTLDTVKKSASDVFSKLGNSKKDPFAAFKGLGKGIGTTIGGIAKGVGALSKDVGDMNPGTVRAFAGALVYLKFGLKGIVFGALIKGLQGLNKMNPSQIKAAAKAITALAVAVTLLKAVGQISSTVGAIRDVFGNFKKTPKTPKTPKIPQAPAGGKAGKSMAGLLKTGASVAMMGVGIAGVGAGFMMIAKGIAQIAATKGGPQILLGMAIGITALLIVVRLLGPALIAGAAGFLVFGAALLLIGVAVLLASAGMALLATQLPLISQYGASAALGILLLGLAMAAFGVLVVVAALGIVILAVALVALGVGFVVAGVGAALFGVALILVAAFSVVASVGLLLLGVSLIIVMAMGIVAAVGMLLLGVSLVLIAAMGIVAAAGMLLLAVALVLIAAVVIIAAVGMMLFAVALLLAAPMMMIAAVGALLLGVASMILAVGLLLVGVALMVVATGLTAAASGVMALASAFVSAGSKLVGAIVGAMQNVVSSVKTGISNAVNAAKGFGSSLVSVGKDLIQGLVNGIKSMIGSAVSAVKSVASSVVNAAKSILHIGSPSKLFDQYGQWVVEGLANGLNGSAGLAANASGDMAKGVVNAASGMAIDGATIGAPVVGKLNAGDQLAGGFYRALDAVNGINQALNGLHSNSDIGINGQISSNADIGATDIGTYASTPSSNNTTNSNQVSIESGAIQINSSGNADYDADRLLTIIENRIVELNNASLGGA